jgi:hypothetical protein
VEAVVVATTPAQEVPNPSDRIAVRLDGIDSTLALLSDAQRGLDQKLTDTQRQLDNKLTQVLEALCALKCEK